jgi:hypothetical protein
VKIWQASIASALLALAVPPWSVGAQQWTAPQPGWLYVLDIGGSSTNGAVFLVNPITDKITYELPFGYHPDFGLCANGSKLYVVSGSQSSGVLSVFATETGNLLTEIPIADRAVYTVQPSTPGITCSNDGRWVFLQQMITVNPGVDEHGLLIVDAQNNRLSPYTIQLPSGCGIAQVIPWPFGTWDIAVECSTTNSLRLIRMSATGNAESIKDIALNLAPQWTVHRTGFPPKTRRMTTSTVVDLADHLLAVFRGAGGVDQLDPETLTLQHKTADSWQQWIAPGCVAISKDGMAFIGSVAYSYDLMDTISAVKTSDWTEVASIHTTLPFWTLRLNLDGQALYAVSPSTQSVTMIDARTLAEIKTIRGLGQQPSLILIQP